MTLHSKLGIEVSTCTDTLPSGLCAAPTMSAAAAGAFSPAFGPAAGPSSGHVFDGLDEASQNALVGIQANGANTASSPMPANPPGMPSMLDDNPFDLLRSGETGKSARSMQPAVVSRRPSSLSHIPACNAWYCQRCLLMPSKEVMADASCEGTNWHSSRVPHASHQPHHVAQPSLMLSAAWPMFCQAHAQSSCSNDKQLHNDVFLQALSWQVQSFTGISSCNVIIIDPGCDENLNLRL